MLFLLFTLVTVTGVIVTRTEFGRERIRAIVERQVTGSMQRGGSLHVGRITGGLLGGFTLDTIALRDADGRLVFSAGRTTVEYDPRDLLDRRLLISRLEIERPYLHLVQYEDGSWNYKRLFERAKAQVERQIGRKFGDFVVIDEARVRDATFLLTMPWHPADSLRGARRDSSIREHLARPGGAFQRTADGYFTRTYRWTEGYAVLSHARIADPDSAGRLFVVDTLHVVESEPPFRFRNARATVRQLGDSVWFQAPHFDTPGSTGRGRGKVVWGSGLPIRYDVRVWGDSVSLRDVAWVYPTLPTTGGGSMVLDIRNDPRNLRIIDYRLSAMDVRSTGSRLRGTMTFAVGGPVLVVKDVDVRADPMDFDLLRTLAGGPFPVDWQGTITGSVKARGGPLTRFVVDEADVVYRDRHVPGAVSALRGRGGLNILDPEFTEFQSFRVDVASLDLRTIQHLYPEFPPLGGTVSGVATLDSSWLDVRFRDADVTHRNGPEVPSRFTGRGRVTYGDEFLVYDLDAVAQPLSLPMMARAYPTLPLTGLVSGPVRAQGTTDSLRLIADLAGEGGRLQFDGIVDIYEPEWKARGTGVLVALDAPRVLTVGELPRTSLNGTYDIDMSFLWGGPAMDSLVALRGRAAVRLDRSMVDSLRLEPSVAALRFADDRVIVDSARVELLGARVLARGALGVAGGAEDSLRLTAVLDSLGALRRYLADRGAAAGLSEDSLAGTLTVEAVARGRLDALAVAGTITGAELVVGTSGADSLAGTFDVANLTRDPEGRGEVRLLRTRVGGIRSDSLATRVAFDGASGGTFAAQLFAGSGPGAHVHAAFQREPDRMLVVVDTLTLAAGDHSLALASPARLVVDTAGGLFLDSLLLRDPQHGSLRLQASLPATGAVTADLRADSMAVADLASLLQRSMGATGTFALDGTLRGTREAPVIRAALRVDEPGLANARFERITAAAAYDTGHFTGDLQVRRAGRTTIAGAFDLPAALTLTSFTRNPTDSVRAWIAADSTDLALLEAHPAIANTRGTLRTRLDLHGTWEDPALRGFLTVAGGGADVRPLGIRLRDLTADVVLAPGTDSIAIRRISAASGPNGTLGLAGYISFAELANPRFDLRLDARNFHAIDDRRVAQLDVSTGSSGLRLSGRMTGATLAGTLSVDRGAIFVPDTRNKTIVDLAAADFFALLDTTEVRNVGLVPPAPSRLVENLRLDGVSIRLGDEVWLRSREANVKLGGALSVTSAVNEGRLGASGDSLQYRLALAGTLNAERGTYTLDLGLARREFEVESGTITFFGTPEFPPNPAVDISALHVVKQRHRDDVRVRVRLTGFVRPAPTIALESASGYAMSQSDLISYLVTGQPSVEYGTFAEGRLAETATSFIAPTFGSWAGATLRESLGGWVDQVRFETGTSDELTSANSVLRRGLGEVFYSSRLGGEKQIGENWFVSLSSGLCQLDRPAGGDDPTLEAFVNQLAWRLEYRFPESLTLQAGREPSRKDYGCNRDGMRGVVNTPAQWAVTLSRSWRF